ncbi:MAG: hypothetical protein KGZ92_06620 [Firmicutes bacterium]|nr:hypothetical protein [Dethiobacter sp.]MBS3888957.1 hypothetical protein [Bacillota bacterium]
MRWLVIVLIFVLLFLSTRLEPSQLYSSKDFVLAQSTDLYTATPALPAPVSAKGWKKPEIALFARDESLLASLVQISEDELLYLLSLQDDNGIIAQTPERLHSIPYFSNMAAMALLSDPRGHEPVRKYMAWYIAHLNRPDKYNFTGTMYDWSKTDGAWQHTYSYDSADSYAATFLSLVLNYTEVTLDASFAIDNIQAIVDVAEVLIRLQDRDGLMWAKPRYYVKFLMDNAENYRGLRDAEKLMQHLGRTDFSARYGHAATRVARGMEKRMWNEADQSYAWAIMGPFWVRQQRQRWYPDTVAQLYPVVFGVIPPNSERASHLYANLNANYPDWTSGRFDDRFPWTVLAYMAALMNDDVRAVSYMKNVHQTITAEHRCYPWHAFESAFYLKAWNKIHARNP